MAILWYGYIVVWLYCDMAILLGGWKALTEVLKYRAYAQILPSR